MRHVTIDGTQAGYLFERWHPDACCLKHQAHSAKPMERRITGFHQDAELHWVAELACGHTQHVRHDPPWQVRAWVTTAEGRAGHIGTRLQCPLCIEPVESAEPR